MLIDLGHTCSHSYETLMKVLSDFKNMEEKTMALTLLHVSLNNQGKMDGITKIV